MSAALLLWVMAVTGADAGFVWDLPAKVVSDVEVAGEIEAAGIPVRMRKLIVGLSAAEVGRHFLQSFRRQGLFVPPGMPYDRVLTGVRPSDYRTFTVLIQQIDPKHCGVILGEAMPMAARPGTKGDPLFPGASHPFETRFESGRTVSFRARATVDELSSFYSEVLGKAGYRRAKDGSWRSQSQSLSVLSTPDPAQPGMRSVVLLWRSISDDEGLQ
jgi:hypothetical protein